MLKVVGASWEKTRLTTIMLGTVTVLAIFAIFFFEVPMDHNDGNYAVTVYWSKTSAFSWKFWGQGNDPQHINPGVARAYYRPDMTHTGWATLEVQTQSNYPDHIQAYAAGLVEGSLCWQLIFWHWQNTVAYNCESHREFCEEARRYLSENSDKIRELAHKNQKTSPLWHQVRLFYAQLDGLEAGWRHGVTKSRKNKEIDIPKIDFLWMNAVADIRDLEVKYNLSGDMDPGKMPISITLFKLLPESKEKFLLAHASSGYYTELLRLQKKYSFGYHMTRDDNARLVPGQTIEFTSYPASIHSQDDFYHVIGEDKLIISGTALKNYNASLWKNLDNEKLLMGPRVMAANRMAHNGSEWGSILESTNGGTGIKQWLILKPKQNSTKIWVVEQIPGKTITLDQTTVLKDRGFLAFYGLPYYEEIKDVIGYEQMESGVKNFFEKVKTLFNSGQNNVTNIDSLVDLMRSPAVALVGRSDIWDIDNISEQYLNTSNNQLPNVTSVQSSDVSTDAVNKGMSKSSVTGGVNNIKSGKLLGFLGKLENLKTEKEEEGEFYTSKLNNKTNVLDSTTFMVRKGGVLRKELNGNLDLKISTAEGNFKASAGPPYTDDETVEPQIEPFQWSKTIFKDIPHYGQSDIWKFDPVEPKWVWN